MPSTSRAQLTDAVMDLITDNALGEISADDMRSVLLSMIQVAASARVFVAESTLAPATAGLPTVAEVTAYAAAYPYYSTWLVYTGGDVSTAPVTHVFYVDDAGDVTVLRQPVPAGSYGEISVAEGGTSWTINDSARRYTHTFVVGDWSIPSNASRTLSIPATTHMRGAAAVVAGIYSGTGPFVLTTIQSVSIATNGDILLIVDDGAEFGGKVVIV